MNLDESTRRAYTCATTPRRDPVTSVRLFSDRYSRYDEGKIGKKRKQKKKKGRKGIGDTRKIEITLEFHLVETIER